MGSMSVSSCRCCMFVSRVHPVAVLNATFCMTCSLLMLVENARGDHMEEAYSRAGLMTALYVDISFCLPHPVAVSDTVNVRAWGAIGLNPFATVLFSVCIAVTVECCVLYLCCMGVFGMFAVM